MADQACLILQYRMRMEAMQQGPEGIKEADTALSVLYNLCIDNGTSLFPVIQSTLIEEYTSQ